MKLGKVHPRRTLFLREHVGEAANGTLKYELATLPGRSPYVRSKKTGKCFTLSWHDILTLAVQAGIDKK